MENKPVINLHRQNVVQLRPDQFMTLENGQVALVRSETVKDLGDHFVVITGPPVLKTHGMRPETLTISSHSESDSQLLDVYDPIGGVIILLLQTKEATQFRYDHGIGLVHGEVIYPKKLVVNEILNIFEGFRLPPTVIDQYQETGRAKLFDRIMEFVRVNDPVKFSMLGYPFKSTNTRDKVLGRLPDLGEQKSLDNFEYLNERIKQVYLPGARFSIISDGYIFSDVWGIPDVDVLAYNEVTKDMGKDYPIQFFDAGDFYKEETTMYAIREKIISQFGISPEVLQKRILMDLNVNTLYRGMIIFMEEELAMKSFPSKSQLTKQAKIMAREAMFRNEAYSSLVQHQFTDHIRLSMHNSTNDGTKYSIQLVHGKYKFSPWHSCLVVHQDGVLETIHRKDAVEAGYELVNQDGRPYYFQEV